MTVTKQELNQRLEDVETTIGKLQQTTSTWPHIHDVDDKRIESLGHDVAMLDERVIATEAIGKLVTSHNDRILEHEDRLNRQGSDYTHLETMSREDRITHGAIAKRAEEAHVRIDTWSDTTTQQVQRLEEDFETLEKVQQIHLRRLNALDSRPKGEATVILTNEELNGRVEYLRGQYDSLRDVLDRHDEAWESIEKGAAAIETLQSNVKSLMLTKLHYYEHNEARVKEIEGLRVEAAEQRDEIVDINRFQEDLGRRLTSHHELIVNAITRIHNIEKCPAVAPDVRIEGVHSQEVPGLKDLVDDMTKRKLGREEKKMLATEDSTLFLAGEIGRLRRRMDEMEDRPPWHRTPTPVDPVGVPIKDDGGLNDKNIPPREVDAKAKAGIEDQIAEALTACAGKIAASIVERMYV